MGVIKLIFAACIIIGGGVAAFVIWGFSVGEVPLWRFLVGWAVVVNAIIYGDKMMQKVWESYDD